MAESRTTGASGKSKREVAAKTLQALLGATPPPARDARTDDEPAETTEIPTTAEPVAAEPAEESAKVSAEESAAEPAPAAGDAQDVQTPGTDEPEQRPAPTPRSAPNKGKRAAPRVPAAPAQLTESSKILQTRIPAALFERVRESKDATGDTHETWFLDALDSVWDELGAVYRPAPERRTRVPVRQRRTRRPSTDPLVAYPLRLDEEERAVLEDCRAEFSPPSLADLVTTIVRLRLDQLDSVSAGRR